MSEPKRTTEPHDRLTRLAAAMTDALDVIPGTDGVRAIVMLREGNRAAAQLHGYDDDVEAIADVFEHLRAVFRANGRDLEVVMVPDDASGLDR